MSLLRKSTVEGRRHLKAAVAEMASSSESATPSHIARKLAAEASLRMDGSALRHQVQRILKNQLGGQRRQARQKAEAVTWSQEWEQCIAQSSDPSGKICFQSTPSGTGCFVATFPPFFAGLQDLQKANLLADLVISCDCTWEVEKTKAGRQMAYCLVYAAVYRKLGKAGYWRRSGWPLALGRNSKENHALYRFSCLQGQLQAFDLPAPRQCHSDWMRGLPRVVKEFWPDCLPCQGVEHMLRALRRKTQRTESGKVVRVPKLPSYQPFACFRCAGAILSVGPHMFGSNRDGLRMSSRSLFTKTMTGADGGMGWQVLCYLTIPPVNNSRRRPTSKSSGACLTRPQASRRPELCAAQLCFLSECVAKGLREESEDYSMCLPDVLLCLQVFASVPKCPQVSASVRKRSQASARGTYDGVPPWWLGLRAPPARRASFGWDGVPLWPGQRARACPFWLGRRAPCGQDSAGRRAPGRRAPFGRDGVLPCGQDSAGRRAPGRRAAFGRDGVPLLAGTACPFGRDGVPRACPFWLGRRAPCGQDSVHQDGVPLLAGTAPFG